MAGGIHSREVGGSASFATSVSTLDPGVPPLDADWVVAVRRPPSRRPYADVVKPAFDRLSALILLVLVVPLMLAVSLAVRLSLGRGVFFVQERVGRGGRPFKLYKFRTMAHCRRKADLPHDGPDRRLAHKHPDDPRLTATGRLLRRLSLDELPQLVNVLKGEMSLVGPRPELPSIVRRYETWQHERHDAKPGMTGPWQVDARDRPMHLATDLDIEYVRRVKPWTDAKILVKTFASVVRRDGW